MNEGWGLDMCGPTAPLGLPPLARPLFLDSVADVEFG